MSRAGVLAGCAAILAAAASVVSWQSGGSPRDEATAPATLDGATLFQSKGCAACHTGPSSATAIGGAPSLVAASSWAGARRAGLTAHDYLVESIRTPSAFLSPQWHGGGGVSGMPDLGLSDAEIAALVDHLLEG